MCVKQFYGYSCGHCSIPTLIQCPLAASNPFFPTCGYPAERPIFTGTFCHPCFRVVWNMRVLKEEEEHRRRHLKGECFCEVRFEGEDRERLLRERAANATSQDSVHAQEAVQQVVEVGTRTNITSIQDASLDFAQPKWQSHGYVSESENSGLFHQQEEIQMNDPSESYAIAVGAHYPHGQLMMGEVGSGMRWYPRPPPLSQLNPPIHKAPMGQRAAVAKTAITSTPASPEPSASCQDAESLGSCHVQEDAEPEQPMIVSSYPAVLDST